MNRFTIILLLLLLTACTQEEKTPFLEQQTISEVPEMKLTSPSFENNGNIPAKFTCDSENVNPELIINGIPLGTKSLALIVDDPDAPSGIWVHWVVWNIKPVEKISENSIPGTQGLNDFKVDEYKGPCPPSGTHRYYFKIYALDTMLNLESSTTKKQLEDAMRGHILAKAELVGKYSKK